MINELNFCKQYIKSNTKNILVIGDNNKILKELFDDNHNVVWYDERLIFTNQFQYKRFEYDLVLIINVAQYIRHRDLRHLLPSFYRAGKRILIVDNRKAKNINTQSTTRVKIK